MPTITEAAAKLAEARQAHGAAVERHQAATDTLARATDRHQAAVGQRERMIADAAARATVNETDLQRARDALDDAADARELHRAVVASTLTAVHRAEIDMLAAVVVEHCARTYDARLAVVAAARDVDAAMEEARAAVRIFQDRCADLRSLADETGTHNAHTLPAVLASNEVLARLHPSQHPKMAAVPGVVLAAALVAVLIRRASDWEGGAREIGSLAAFVASLAPATEPAAA